MELCAVQPGQNKKVMFWQLVTIEFVIYDKICGKSQHVKIPGVLRQFQLVSASLSPPTSQQALLPNFNDHLCFLTFLSWPGSGPRAGYYFSAAFVLAGTALLSLIDVHKNNLRRRRRRRQNSCRREEEVMGEWQKNQLSF